MRIFGLAHLTKDIILKENVWYSFFLPYAQRDKPLTKTLFLSASHQTSNKPCASFVSFFTSKGYSLLKSEILMTPWLKMLR